MAQWINLNRNNRSVVACQYPLLWEKTGPILPPMVGLTVGKQAGWKTKYGWISKFLKLSSYRLNCLDFCFVYCQCNVTIVLPMHFSWVFSSKAYFKACFVVQKFSCHFISCQSLPLSTNVLNDNRLVYCANIMQAYWVKSDKRFLIEHLSLESYTCIQFLKFGVVQLHV